MMKTSLAVFASVLLLVALSGCDSDATNPLSPGQTGGGDESVDLDDPYGGFTFSDEAPSFGEPELFEDELIAEDAAFEDEYEDDPEVMKARHCRGARVFMLRINWGKLIRSDGDSNVCVQGEIVRDWSGSLEVERGAILVRRTIKFEEGDYIHRRTDRRLVEWTSTTGPHFDGILVQIIDPPGRSGPDSTDSGHGGGGGRNNVPNRVIFRTPQYSRTFTMDELVKISELVELDECGNGVSFAGFAVSQSRCPKGFVAGIWKPAAPDTVPPDSSVAQADTSGPRILGHFYGNWVQQNGALAGRVRGVYGINSEGRRVFFGKYIDLSGKFEGILKGTYGSMSMEPGPSRAGWFDGEWIGKSHRAVGKVRGRWIAPFNAQHGVFHGRWRTDCPDSPPEGGA